MIKSAQTAEAAALNKRLLAWLAASAPGASVSGAAGSALRRALGDLFVNVAVMFDEGSYAQNLADAFNLARLSGASYDTIDVVRQNLIAERPVGQLAQALVQLSLEQSLIQQARINAGTDFASRDDVDRMLQRVVTSFDPVITYEADIGDAAAYLSMIRLYAASINDLVNRSRPLPRLLNYSTTESTPTMVLANMLYPSSTLPGASKTVLQRSNELILENHIVHPAFPPLTGRCLSDFG